MAPASNYVCHRPNVVLKSSNTEGIESPNFIIGVSVCYFRDSGRHQQKSPARDAECKTNAKRKVYRASITSERFVSVSNCLLFVLCRCFILLVRSSYSNKCKAGAHRYRYLRKLYPPWSRSQTPLENRTVPKSYHYGFYVFNGYHTRALVCHDHIQRKHLWTCQTARDEKTERGRPTWTRFLSTAQMNGAIFRKWQIHTPYLWSCCSVNSTSICLNTWHATVGPWRPDLGETE